MYYRSIPETPDTFYAWLKAWHELVGPLGFADVQKWHDTKKGNYFTLTATTKEFVKRGESTTVCDLIISYELKEIELMTVTIDKHCRHELSKLQAEDIEKVITGLVAAIDTRWPQYQMSYDDAYRRIAAGENRTKIKKEFQRANPNITDDSFYAAMYRRRKNK